MKRPYSIVVILLFLLTNTTRAKKIDVIVNINQNGIEDCMTGIIPSHNNEILIFPNPTSNLINIEFHENITGVVQIINTQGMVVKEIPLNNQKKQEINLDGCKGLVFIRISTQFGNYSEKVILY